MERSGARLERIDRVEEHDIETRDYTEFLFWEGTTESWKPSGASSSQREDSNHEAMIELEVAEAVYEGHKKADFLTKTQRPNRHWFDRSVYESEKERQQAAKSDEDATTADAKHRVRDIPSIKYRLVAKEVK